MKRRSSLVERAQRMAEGREAERLRLAEAMRELQFRENYDALRSRQSHQRAHNAVQEQQEQVCQRSYLADDAWYAVHTALYKGMKCQVCPP